MVKGQIKVTPLRCTPTPLNQCPHPVSISYTIRFPQSSLDKILQVKVTTARSKVKSRSLHNVAHLHPLTNVPKTHQLPTPYGFRDIARTKFYRSRSLRKVKSRSLHNVAHLHPLTNVPKTHQLPTPYGFRDIARTKFYRSRSLRKVKSSLRHDIAHLHPLNNVPTKYQLPPSYGCRDIARDKIL